MVRENQERWQAENPSEWTTMQFATSVLGKKILQIAQRTFGSTGIGKEDASSTRIEPHLRPSS